MLYLVGRLLSYYPRRKSLALVILMALLWVVGLQTSQVIAATAVSYQPPNHNTARKNYLAAVRALRKKDYDSYALLAKDLIDYPLYGYLRYEYLASLPDITPAQAFEIKKQFNNPLIAEKVDLLLLENLGKNKKWDELRSLYPSVQQPTTVMDCYYGEALYHHGEYAKAFAIAEEKWTVAYSQPSECDGLFGIWLRQPGKPGKAAWDRYREAVRYGEHGIADYVYKRFLGKNYQSYADLYKTLRKTPEAVKYLTLDVNDYLHKDFYYSALRRLVDSDLEYVNQQLASPSVSEWLTPSKVERIKRSIAILDIRKGVDGALDAALVSNINKKINYFDDLTFQYYLHREEWNNLLSFIESQPQSVQTSEQMQYWRARALEQIEPDAALANKIYTELSEYRSYYGFLSADKLKKPYKVVLGNHPYDKYFLPVLAHYPGVIRAYELFRLNDVEAAEKEWNQVMETLDRQGKTAATILAFRWGMHHFAITSAVDAEAYRFLATRFPIAHKQHFESQAKALNISADWLMAVARQESAFDHKAVSRANARGLMQIIPDTARETAEQFDLAYNSVNDLFKPSTNIAVGSHYLDSMAERFSNNRILATASYNAGPHRVENWVQYSDKPLSADIWIELIPFSETREYVKRVLSYNVIYQHRLDKPMALFQENEWVVHREQDTYYVQSVTAPADGALLATSDNQVEENGSAEQLVPPATNSPDYE